MSALEIQKKMRCNEGAVEHPIAGLARFTSQRMRQIIAMAGLGWMLAAGAAQAQTQSVEMQAGNGGPAGNGPTVANQTVTLRLNPDNPTGNTFTALTPPITVTYSLSNQQYTGLTAAQGFPAGTGGNAVVFGGNVSSPGTNTMSSVPLYPAMNAYGAPANAMFTSSGGSAAGTGIGTSTNGAMSLFISATALALQPAGSRPATNSRVRMADLTLTFSTPVANPILHFAGLGATAVLPPNMLGLSTEFDVLTPGVTLTRLSGNAVFNAGGTQVTNTAAAPGSSCSAADDSACGSVRVNGNNLTAVTLRVFLRGDGGAAQWDAGVSPSNAGDVSVLGVSLTPPADLSVTKTNTPASGPGDLAGDTVTSGQTTTYTLVINNAGPGIAHGAVIRDIPVSGLSACAVLSCTASTSPASQCPATPANIFTASGAPLPSLPNGGRVTLTVRCNVD